MSGWAALAGVAGNLLDTGLQMYSARDAWKKQKEAIQNAHQWEVEDLRKAGLNPILSATGGSGSSTGGLNQPMVSSNFGSVLNSASAVSLRREQEKLLQEQVNTEKWKQGLLIDQGNQARTQALINNENALRAYRENEYYRKNPQVYDVLMKQKALPSVGGLAAVGEDIAEGFLNSAMKLLGGK